MPPASAPAAPAAVAALAASAAVAPAAPVVPRSPLFSGLRERRVGILLHPTSLPSRQGVGSLGAGAREFVDFAAESGFAWWQVCPLGPTGYGDSPYQCFSAFAGNPYLIDLSEVVEAGLLDERDLAPLRQLAEDRVEYGYLWEHFHTALGKAARTAIGRPALLEAFGDVAAFRREKAAWLDDYALFSALKKFFAGKPWHEWPEAARNHREAVKTRWPAAVAAEVEAEVVKQFLFFAQWTALRGHARKRGLRILGDSPIFVARDSADVWANPQFFQLGEDGLPSHVAGVPPDYFSPAGQLWGNPLYDWDALKKDGYRWWLRRLAADLALCDAVRIDHFRGFHDYWQIPADAPDARSGCWQRGPGLDFFKTVRRELGDAALVAEDLGDLDDGVRGLRRETGLQGMAVLQFAFGGDARNSYLPHNHSRDCVVYPGTHDNDTSVGWYAAATEAERDFFRCYFGSVGTEPNWTLIRAAYASPAVLAVVSLQDVLGKGSTARFNTPGVASGNWCWRVTVAELAHAKTFLTPNLHRLAEVTDRLA
ncbi:MAG: 4-alpha-glucanotransferase [Puniceicoccales bacterium]|jgi:4-alpha-glucanotransferase|nr:4-alpha-glucanotransferase [Puniceicoccales bacterium]